HTTENLSPTTGDRLQCHSRLVAAISKSPGLTGTFKAYCGKQNSPPVVPGAASVVIAIRPGWLYESLCNAVGQFRLTVIVVKVVPPCRKRFRATVYIPAAAYSFGRMRAYMAFISRIRGRTFS